MADSEPFVLLGVMSNPSSPMLRNNIRDWTSKFKSVGKASSVKFVFGNEFYNGSMPAPPVLLPAIEEVRTHDDFFFVDAREHLPHVGVVTEKSAMWWRTVALREPRYSYYCKSDDDTLVHLDRLASVLRGVAIPSESHVTHASGGNVAELPARHARPSCAGSSVHAHAPTFCSHVILTFESLCFTFVQ